MSVLALQKMVARGATSQSVLLRVQNQISFVPQTSFMPSAAGFVLKYFRMSDSGQVDAGTAITPTSVAGLSVGWASGAVIPIWDGYLRVDVPDAAFANAVGVNSVLVTAQATALIFSGALVQLIDGDNKIAAPTPQKY